MIAKQLAAHGVTITAHQEVLAQPAPHHKYIIATLNLLALLQAENGASQHLALHGAQLPVQPAHQQKSTTATQNQNVNQQAARGAIITAHHTLVQPAHQQKSGIATQKLIANLQEEIGVGIIVILTPAQLVLHLNRGIVK